MEKIDSKQLIRYLKQNSNDLGVLLNIFSSNDYNEALEQINVGAFIFNNINDESIIKNLLLNSDVLKKINNNYLIDLIYDFQNNETKIEILSNKNILNRVNINALIELVENIPLELKIQLLNNFEILKKLCSFNITETARIIDELYIQNNIEIPNILKKYYEYTKKSNNSNSDIMRKLNYNLVKNIIFENNFEEKYNNIEKIFLQDDIPEFAKIFLVFKFLNPNLECFDRNRPLLNIEYFFKDKLNEALAPQLKNDYVKKYIIKHFNKNFENLEIEKQTKMINDVKFMFIYNDIARISISSNNSSLRSYLKKLEEGNSLYLSIIKGNVQYNSLDENELELLNSFEKSLERLMGFIQRRNDVELENKNIVEKIKIIADYFRPTNRYSLLDRIVRSFFGQLGYTSYEQLINEMDKIVTITTEKGVSNEESIGDNALKLENNDFVRFIGDINVFVNSFENGNFSKEYMGMINGTTDFDSTPGDIDFFRIETEEDSSIQPISFFKKSFTYEWPGNIYIVIRNNSNINITRNEMDELYCEYDYKKIEAFQIGFDGINHWGIRTGISMTDVDYILIDTEKNQNNNSDIEIIKNTLVKKGIYIPVYNLYGKKVFSYKEFISLQNGIDLDEENSILQNNNRHL